MEWKDVVGYEGLYSVSEFGDVYSFPRKYKQGNKIIKSHLHKFGYMIVYLCHNNITKTVKLHRVVAQAFVPNPENKPHVNHIDGNKTNNHYSNLEWCTAKENILHAWNTGLSKSKPRDENCLTKITEADMVFVAVDYAVNNMTQTDIALKYGISQSNVPHLIKAYLKDRLLEKGLAIDKTKL